MDLHMWIS